MMNITVIILLAGTQNVNKIGSVHWNDGILEWWKDGRMKNRNDGMVE